MKKLLLIFFFAFCLLPFALQSQWVQQTVPVSKPITGIKFIDANTGWSIADIGTGGANYSYILHTTNGGTNWQLQDSSFGSSLLALSVVNVNIAYCGGFDGAATANLHKTTNGGLNWFVIPTPTNMSILDMQFLNKDSGWTVGGSVGADVRTTTDGGLTWQVRISGIAAQTQRIFFLNYSTGFCGANFDLYKTTNAGMNWTISSSFSQSLQSIFFLNQNTGWVGTGNQIQYTSNAGSNWVTQFLPAQGNNNLYDLFFFNNSTGYGGTGLNRIFKTTNGGQNWGYQIDTGGSYRISFIDSSLGWTCWLGAKICKTTNGGGAIFYTGFTPQGTNIPSVFTLYQNYPNPFNPVTTVKVDIPKASNIRFVIFDIIGKVLYEENEYLRAGSYEFKWDASSYSSGVYFYTLISDKFTETKKMLLLK